MKNKVLIVLHDMKGESISYPVSDSRTAHALTRNIMASGIWLHLPGKSVFYTPYSIFRVELIDLEEAGDDQPVQ